MNKNPSKDVVILQRLGLSNYLIDKILSLTGGSGSSTGNTGPYYQPIIVKVGTSEATDLNIVNGGTTIVNANFSNRGVLVFINNALIPGQNPGSGDPYFTKPFSSNTISFGNKILETDDWVIIVIL